MQHRSGMPGVIVRLLPAVLLGIAATTAPQPVAGGGHQLLCAQPVGGIVSSASGSYELRAVLDWPAGGPVYQSQNYRMIQGCKAASFNASYFDALFQDRFESQGTSD